MPNEKKPKTKYVEYLRHAEFVSYTHLWEVVAVYQDDGFTGLNMERPDLQRMLRAIERRRCV